MATASFVVLKCTGTNAATLTDCGKHPCFLSADTTSTLQNSYPILAPATSSDNANYSYELWLKLKLSAAPDNYCQNFKFYGANVQPDVAGKLTVYVPASTGKVCAITTGVTPVSSASSIATVRQDTTHFDLGTALTFHAGQISTVNQVTSYLVLQLKVDYLAQQGPIATLVPNVSWEEV
jgi:hypothetical protein